MKNAARLVVDTKIVSYVLKESPLAEPYGKHLKGRKLYLSFITIGELYLWAETANWGERRRLELRRTIRGYGLLMFDDEVAVQYAGIVGAAQRKGVAISSNDAWIAATALRHGLPLVTQNAKDFAGVDGLAIVTEATA